MNAKALLFAIASAGAMGCGLPTGETFIYPADGPELACASVDATTGVWQSAPIADPACPWLSFPPRGTVEVEHTLGRAPVSVGGLISFEESGAEAAFIAGRSRSAPRGRLHDRRAPQRHERAVLSEVDRRVSEPAPDSEDLRGGPERSRSTSATSARSRRSGFSPRSRVSAA